MRLFRNLSTAALFACVLYVAVLSAWAAAPAPVRPDTGMPIISPGRPDLSLLLKRMRSTTPGERMPPIATIRVDSDAIALFTAWIAEMK